MELEKRKNLTSGDRLAIFAEMKPGDFFVEEWRRVRRDGEAYALECDYPVAFHVKVPKAVSDSAHMVNWMAYSHANGPAEVRPYSECGEGRGAFEAHDAYFHRDTGVLSIGDNAWIKTVGRVNGEGAVRLVAADGSVAHALGPNGWRVQSVRL